MEYRQPDNKNSNKLQALKDKPRRTGTGTGPQNFYLKVQGLTSGGWEIRQEEARSQGLESAVCQLFVGTKAGGWVGGLWGWTGFAHTGEAHRGVYGSPAEVIQVRERGSTQNFRGSD
ncbi:hypothetical protein ATANTOWER_022225 [Ataeniobius toweri]|uniref:Uncharacterized protein n=1 Tax=Ataeniobius toweri TaxID=208326 RepID=A0ABU7CHY7_9TELE|nr:hypothetical protein [Ataeniobius toweri]